MSDDADYWTYVTRTDIQGRCSALFDKVMDGEFLLVCDRHGAPELAIIPLKWADEVMDIPSERKAMAAERAADRKRQAEQAEWSRDFDTFLADQKRKGHC